MKQASKSEEVIREIKVKLSDYEIISQEVKQLRMETE